MQVFETAAAVTANDPDTCAVGAMLDLDRLRFGPDGVTPFLVPLGRDEMVAVRNGFLDALIPLCENRYGNGDADAGIIGILVVQWAITLLRLYQATALCRRYRALTVTPIFSSRTPFFAAVFDGNPPPDEPYITTLLSGPPRPDVWLGPARMARNILVRDGISRRPAALLNFDRDIVVTSTGPLIYRHSRSVDDRVCYVRPSYWFGALDPDQDGRRFKLVGPVMDAAAAGFEAGSEPLSPESSAWLERQVTISANAIHRHLSGPALRPTQLPKRLWLGGGGNLWVRLLRKAVKQAGGDVTGHDHGSGSGHLISTRQALVDFMDCDSFVTFSSGQAVALRENVPQKYLLGAPLPKIIAAPNPQPETAAAPRDQSRSTSANGDGTIMVMPFGSEGDRPHYIPLPCDIAKVDLHARLIGHLKAWDYRVLLKPHPEFLGPPAEAYEKYLEVQSLLGRFEEVLDQADTLLFTHPLTSTFGYSLKTAKNIILIDLELEPWAPGARELLARRCAIVKAWYDDQNRVQVDWDQLRTAIGDCAALRDPGFANHYLWPDR